MTRDQDHPPLDLALPEGSLLDTAPSAASSPGDRKHCILVVDDEPLIRDSLGRLLRGVGYEVLEAGDGANALEILERERVDLILLDLRMPGMSGQETLSHLRTRWQRTEMPVMVITADADSRTTVEALRLGANDFLHKPFNFEEVEARIAAHLDVKETFSKASTSSHKRMTTRGKRGVSVSSEMPFVVPRRHCPSCVTLLWDDAANCLGCGTERPLSGWPSPALSGVPMLGRIIGDRYLLDHRIGKGATSQVFRARDLELDRRFAIKIIDLTGTHNITQERLRTEIEALARVHSPHVVRIYEVFQLDEDIIALVMDHARGQTLGRLLEEGSPMQPVRILKALRQVSQGLHEVHALGMVHRDVKPDNIMVETLPHGEDFAMILDFGIAQTRKTEAEGQSLSFYGTPLYAPPEQFRAGSRVDARADVYALGVTLFEVITGNPPFEASSLFDLVELHRSQPVPRLPEGCCLPHERHALDDLIQTLMNKDPEARPARVTEVIKLIDDTIALIEDTDRR